MTQALYEYLDKNTSDNVAIIEENGKKISYIALKQLSDKFASYLANLNSTSQYVGIISPVNINSIAAIIGILKIGYAYVPLDELSPERRLSKIINNTQIETIIVDAVFYSKIENLIDMTIIKNVIVYNNDSTFIKKANHHTIDDILMYSTNVVTKKIINPDDIAYILHSSGSTGTPKGIKMSHKNALTFITWMHKTFSVTSQDIIISRSPLKFDLSIFDIFNTLKAGATLACYTQLVHSNTKEKYQNYVKFLINTKATILYTTPSTLIALMNYADLKEVNSLRLIMYAGEPFPVNQLKKLRSIFSSIKIANLYGPTETNVITYHFVTNNDLGNNINIPIGRAVDKAVIILVSNDGTKLCKDYELGELWCSGSMVCQGYLNTSSNFIVSPFHKNKKIFWNTGDLAYRDEDGLLHYKGRKDNMVKIKGYRVELGEIESAIVQHPDIVQTCVVVTKNNKSYDILNCFYSTHNQLPILERKIYLWLKDRVPEYMLPSSFIFIDQLPITSNGKIDRNLLIQSRFIK